MTIGKTKITSGKFKSRMILTPGTENTHPMGSRQRLALFNMLLPYLQGANVLDTYAGSGVLGIEALSRGAASATFIDNDAKAVATIRQNLSDLKITDITEVIADQVEHFSTMSQFDIVFVDPPYNIYGPGVIWTVIRNLLPVIKKSGVLVLSHPPSDAPLLFEDFTEITSRQYAGAVISIFQRNS